MSELPFVRGVVIAVLLTRPVLMAAIPEPSGAPSEKPVVTTTPKHKAPSPRPAGQEGHRTACLGHRDRTQVAGRPSAHGG